MRNEQERGTGRPVKIKQQRFDALARFLIEVSRRLIRKQNARPMHKGAGHRDALLLAAGELCGIMLEAIGQTDTAQQIGRLPARGSIAAQFEGHHDILERGERRDELKGLKHEACLAAAQLCPLVLAQMLESLAAEMNGAAAGTVESSTKPQQRRLAASRGTDDRTCVAVVKGKRYVLNDSKSMGARHISLRKLPDVKYIFSHAVRFTMRFTIKNPRSLYFLLVISVLWMGGCENSSQTARETTVSDTFRTQDAQPRSDSGRVDEGRSAHEILVLVMGNSLTEGYGLASQRKAFPALLQRRVDSLGWDVEIVNAGVSGQTSSGGLGRIGWVLRQPLDILILELGGNDGLRGIDPSVTRRNLQAIIDSTRARYPDARIMLAGIRIPPNLGQAYAERFYDIYPSLADENDLIFLPHLMEGVAGHPSLMQGDGIHPTAAGHRRMAMNVWDKLRPVLEEMREEAQAANGGEAREEARVQFSGEAQAEQLI